MTKPSLILTASLSLSILLSACATTPAPQTTNTPADREKRASELFRMFDENGDGFLTRDEMKRSMAYSGNYNPNSNIMLGLESNKKNTKTQSKRMTATEVKKAIDDAFVNDADLDNRLSEQEFKKLVVERKPTEPDPFATL
ncbi:MAG TPA: EF-hand domain-containing protein [Bdellovibrionales bacterium]|nr:EF-hand domain-containing protein [Bdellovibrionales bacterium]